MEASDVVPAEPVEEGKTVETFSGDDGQQPAGEEDGHGSVTPSSAPDPTTQSGDPLDPVTKAAIEGNPPAAGEGAPSQPVAQGAASPPIP
jgi:hypothetical protein